MNKVKSWFYEKIKISNPLARPIKKKKPHKLPILGMKRGHHHRYIDINRMTRGKLCIALCQ